MLDEIFSTAFFNLLTETLNKERSLLLEALWDCPKALVLSHLLNNSRSDVLAISGGDRESKLLDDLKGL